MPSWIQKIIDFVSGLKLAARIPAIKQLVADASEALKDKTLSQEEIKVLVADLEALLK